MPKRLNDKSGMILVIVTMMVIVLSVVMIGLIGRNYSFVLSSEEQLRHMEAELVAKGAFWRAYQNLSEDPPGPINDYSEVIEGRSYTVIYSNTAGVGAFANTEKIDVQVTY